MQDPNQGQSELASCNEAGVGEQGIVAEPTAEVEPGEIIESDGVGELESTGLNLGALVEALLLVNGEPLSRERLSEITRADPDALEMALADLRNRYQTEASGFQLVEVAEMIQLRTKPAFADFIRELKAQRPRRLSQAALETLSIIAYRQPVVRSDIEKVRGVDVAPTLKTLLERSIIRIVGHQNTVGQPALYGTTDDFLKLFGLKSLRELPTLRDLRELEREPGEEADSVDPVAQTASLPSEEADGTSALP